MERNELDDIMRSIKTIGECYAIKPTIQQVTMMANAMLPYGSESAWKACRTALNKSKFFPSIAEMVAILETGNIDGEKRSRPLPPMIEPQKLLPPTSTFTFPWGDKIRENPKNFIRGFRQTGPMMKKGPRPELYAHVRQAILDAVGKEEATRLWKECESEIVKSIY